MSSAGERCKAIFGTCKVVLVTDDKVAPLYLEKVKASFVSAGYETVEFIFKNGEESKNIDTLSQLLEFMAENRVTRSDTVVALGGGVTGDMAGFAAAVFLRGIRFVQMPTTLLAMVDSSVGGKTAVDLKAGKNLAGAFYQPDLVLCDYNALDTLEPEIFAEGMAEVIKYGVIFDKDLFNLVKNSDVKKNIEKIITRCVELKRDVVEADEHDKGERQLLNFGHTIGHAVEKCSNFGISHGNAVAIGMVIAAKASYALGWVNENCTDDIIEALKNNSLPTESEFSAEELYDVTLNDKKRTGGTISLVIPEVMGKCVLKKVPVSQVLDFIKSGI
ncbi:MAG: 3-dehydroquinate synthase [Clostridia bacterium]|nr:3-dehydroquinate synthase [Clostridia bacterium]